MCISFSISPAVCSASDNEGTTILNVNRGLVFSLIGVAHEVWARLRNHPEGATLETMVNWLGERFPSVERRQILHDIENVMNQLEQKELVQTNSSNKAKSPQFQQGLVRFLCGCLPVLLKLRLNNTAAMVELLFLDLMLTVGGFPALHSAVKRWRMPERNELQQERTLKMMIEAMNLAVRHYPKHTLCLQRSAALTCLLRSCGVPAQMVIACRRIPFKGHAWVEVNGTVVNDNPRVQIVCQNVLDRC